MARNAVSHVIVELSGGAGRSRLGRDRLAPTVLPLAGFGDAGKAMGINVPCHSPLGNLL
jgi:hypothetical protein